MLNNRVARWTMAAALAAAALMQTQSGALLAGALIEPMSQAAAQTPPLPPPPASMQPARRPDVIYVPTNEEVVRGMLKLAGVTKDDIVYDLGCGDGRIPVIAARDFGARGVGIDIDPQRIAEANANVKQAGVGNRVQIRQNDLFTADIKEATVVTLYLLQSLNMKLRPKLMADLKPGTRVVSHAFDMGDEWKPEKTEEIGGTRIFLWTIPRRRSRRRTMERVLGRFAGELYAFLRIVAGFLFACHGAQKLLGALGGHQAQLASQMGLASVIEMVGGSLIAIGLFTSPAAFVASGEMAFA